MAVQTSAEARDEFDVFNHRTYLNWASLSPAPRRAVASATRMLGEASSFEHGGVSEAWYELSSEVRKEAAALLGARADEIAVPGSSTTHGIQLAFDCIAPRKGDNIVASDLEFPSTAAELQKWGERGAETRIVRTSAGRVNPDDIVSAIDSKTRAVVVSSVVWVSGYRTDLRAVSEAARDAGAYLVVDGVQHLGALGFDVRDVMPDFLAAGGQKWLTSPFGAAILYVSRRASEELDPPHYALNNSVEPEEGWMHFLSSADSNPFANYRLTERAKKLEFGGWVNQIGMVALKESLSIINSVGIDSIERRIKALGSKLVSQLELAGARIISSQEDAERSGITLFSVASNQEKHREIVSLLANMGIDVSCRGSTGVEGIRASIHHMNNEQDIERMVGAVRKLAPD